MSSALHHAPLVLLVSGAADESDDQYSRYLRAARFNVAEVVDGDGVRGLRAQPDVVVLDLVQPEHLADGIDLTQRLRLGERTKEIPIILLSRSLAPEDEERAERAGADRVLPKPCPPEVLACEVRRVIAARRRQSWRPR